MNEQARATFNNILSWAEQHGRTHLPWQADITPYRVWISEIMLQQTQVATVIPYFQRFIDAFPTVAALAKSGEDEVLALWSGLGYYSRARNLRKTAEIVVHDYAGIFPESESGLQCLPGIGRYTAAAIVSIAFQIRAPILDGNVKRVLARFFAIEGWPGQSSVANRLWDLAETTTPDEQPRAYTQGVLDLGATVCTKASPDCQACPLSDHCQAYLLDLIEDYPTTKPKQAKPTRSVQFLMLYNPAGEWLLEKRPPTGIWAGLWGFPECDLDTDIHSWLMEQWGLSVQSMSAQASFRHTFTHFYLHIHPLHIYCHENNQIRDNTQTGRWMTVDEACQSGIASPTRALLKKLKQV